MIQHADTKLANSFYLFSFCRNFSQTTVSSGSDSRRTVTTHTPLWPTGTKGLVVSGLWPSTRGGKLKWAPAHGSNPSMSPPTSYPGPAFIRRMKVASKSQKGAKREGKLHPLRLKSHQELSRDAYRSNTGPSTGLDSLFQTLQTFQSFRGSVKTVENLKGLPDTTTEMSLIKLW